MSSFEQRDPSYARTSCGNKWDYYPRKTHCPSCGGEIIEKYPEKDNKKGLGLIEFLEKK